MLLHVVDNVVRFERKARAGWTLSEHQAIAQLAGRMRAELEMGRAEDGAPWAHLVGGQVEVSIVREGTRVAMLDPEGRPMYVRGTVRSLVATFEGSWWVKGAA